MQTDQLEGAQDVDADAANKDLADELSMIANYYVMAQDTNRARTYRNASVSIANYPDIITSGAQAQSIRGIGPSVGTDIDQFLRTGTISRLHDLEQRFSDRKLVIDSFRNIYGIGPVAATKFYARGYRTLADLWNSGLLNEKQQLGILWRLHINLRIPRAEMDDIRARIAQLLEGYGIKWEIAGSYRRQEPESGDIDMLVEARHDLNMNGVLSLLAPILPATLANGPTKFMGVVRLSDHTNAHRIDIRLVEPRHWPAALMYFTGSQKFNILMRNVAISMGLRLNEYALTDVEERPLLAVTEEDIFRILRVRYMAPVQRVRNLATLPML
jgi:DNA polymerase/3'-5' exonuclease PolX